MVFLVLVQIHIVSFLCPYNHFRVAIKKIIIIISIAIIAITNGLKMAPNEVVSMNFWGGSLSGGGA
ncbi:hypothetical protein STIV2_E65 [Sulfolobus turreted icosahedral virus 2]|uniref:Uncharacterized protein n=1 Tax=Sulfolobus turreted icosahedral virus 2 TaxID=754004 RepID=D5IEX1_9VIRU|nr:hypothetical protein STIV2_E65 [Sulfolobus turreted icosahedral virus 2]ADF27774.1 hypothetical protein STIV2_E65 [Sulfolobus turreted icosahedral virus 2]